MAKIYSTSAIWILKAEAMPVYLVGHMAPGSDERQRGAFPATHPQAFTDHHNRRYLKLVRRYADIIVGQFFGHLHSDTFRVIYNEHGKYEAKASSGSPL
ncbi:hypothetical protein HHI36_011954 [Cryptolaemus montrouzieri]|uniref:Uncharacterized protein n=1 Tax=Cryptolaemus montrouzieri TaxID=559131 RepID=A0ABD2NDM5_9CUCU